LFLLFLRKEEGILVKIFMRRACSTEVSRRGLLDSGCVGPAILHTTGARIIVIR
jgi:hypothetical protein